MPDKTPSEIDTVDTSDNGYESADATFQADLLSEGTDDDTTTGINAALVSKIGKTGTPHGDVLRVIFADGIGDLVAGDTFSVFETSTHNTSTMEILAYTSSSTVTTTGQIQISWGSGENIWTLTSGFIAALVDLGSGSFGIRMADSAEGGDVQIAEVRADFSAGGEPEPEPEETLAVHGPIGGVVVHGPGRPGGKGGP